MAGAVVGALRVVLGADTAQFETGMKRASSRAQRVARGISNAFKIATAAIAAAGLAIGVAVRGAINEADKMSKAAQSVGLATDELSRLAHAADLSGVSFETLSKAMQRLSVNMNDVANGVGETAGRAFEQLGIAVTTADGAFKSSTTIFGEVADRFAGLDDGARKTAIAIALFGRAGADLVPLLNQGSSGIADMAAEADRLGIVIDTRTGRAAEAFNDNLNRLGKIFGGIITQITARLLPTLKNLSDVLVGVATDSKTLDAIADALAFTFKTVLSAAIGAAGGIRALGHELAAIGAAAQAVVALDFTGAFAALEKGAADSEATLRATRDTIAALWAETATEVSTAVEPIASSVTLPAKTVLNEIDKASTKTKDTVKEIRAELTPLGSQMQSTFSGVFDAIVDGTFNARDAISGLLRDMASLFANQAFRQILSSGAFGGVFGSGGGGGGRILSSLFSFLPGFATGGAFRVGGAGGTDSQMVAFRATPGETVSVATPGQMAAGGPQRVAVDISLSDDLDARVTQVSGAVAVRVVDEKTPGIVRTVDRKLAEGEMRGFRAATGIRPAGIRR